MWHLSIVLYAITGLWIFLVLQLGYLTNTIYGYMCWTKYIKNKQNNSEESVVMNNKHFIDQGKK